MTDDKIVGPHEFKASKKLSLYQNWKHLRCWSLGHAFKVLTCELTLLLDMISRTMGCPYLRSVYVFVGLACRYRRLESNQNGQQRSALL
jgi:hypothetical protein